MNERLIFHVDVNSTFLSWEAARRVKNGESDLRLIPSCIGGDPNSRRGVVLAKSIPAKAFKIKTGEPIALAFRKCPQLVIAKPDFKLYSACSKAFKDICRSYAPVVEEFSIDECFIAALTDYTALEKKAEIIDSALAGVAARIEQLVKSNETDTYISHDVVMRVEILLQGLTSDLSFTIMGERKVTLLRMEVIMANNTKERILAAALEMFSQNGYHAQFLSLRAAVLQGARFCGNRQRTNGQWDTFYTDGI